VKINPVLAKPRTPCNTEVITSQMWPLLLALHVTNKGVIKIKQAIVNQTDGKWFEGGRCCFYAADFSQELVLYYHCLEIHEHIF